MKAVAELPVQVRAIVQSMHLMYANPGPQMRMGLDRIHQCDRFAVGKRKDDVSALADVCDDRLS